MTRIVLRGLVAGLVLAAAPVLAQDPGAGQPRRDSGPYEERSDRGMGRHGRGGDHMGRGSFAGMSEAGREVMREAMRDRSERRADRDAVRAARDRMLTLLDAERLDAGALRRAMDEEREIANASRERKQAQLLAGFAKLSVADRRAFVASSRAMRERMEMRFRQFRERRAGGDAAFY